MNKRLLCGWVLLMAAGSAQAAVYTWVDAQGTRHYSDHAATANAEQARLPGLQSADGNADALRNLQAQAARAAASKPTNAGDPRALAFTQPEAGQTLRNTQGQVPVALTIAGTSSLKPGEKITYYLDGNAIPDMPTTQTQLTLAEVQRGSHTLSAALLYRGREIKRTSPLTFYMRPPLAISPSQTGQSGGDDGPDPIPGAATAPPAGNANGAMAAPGFQSSSAAAGS